MSQGRGDGGYGPDGELNRGQMASFLIRLWTDHLGEQCPSGVVVPFTDTAGTTHEANIECLFGLGITQGTSATTYGPQDPLKASQISRFLYRTYQKAGGDQCQTTAGSELARASECLFNLRVVPSTAEATAGTPVIRSQMGVYLIGLWHNLTGRGLPPAPPQLGAATPSATTTTRLAVTQEPATADGPGIWVMNADGTGLEQISTSGWDPVWSPDGSHVAYADSSEDGGIWVVGAGGANPKKIVSSGRYPLWSPDGARIAFAGYGESGGGLWIVGADGANPKQIAASGWDPVWSPDGLRVAYRRTDSDGLWVVGADGANPKQISTSGGAPVWSPDGSRIAFNDDRGLWVLGADGAGLTQLSSYGRDPAWSPDGSRIAYYETLDDLYGVWTVGADGSNARQIVPDFGGAPVWSPDGSRIAFRVSGSGGRLWVVGADGTGLKQILTFGGAPVWSPDGSRIASGSYDYGNGLWVVDADGANASQVASAGGDPVWSPDGSRFAYTVRGGDGGLWVVDANGGNNRQTLAKNSPHDLDAEWSRDGARISFTSDYFIEEPPVEAEGTPTEVAEESAGDESGPSGELLRLHVKANVIDRYGDDHPWLVETWEFTDRPDFEFWIGGSGWKGANIGNPFVGEDELDYRIARGLVVPDTTHLSADYDGFYVRELARIYVESAHVRSDPTPLAVAQLFFNRHRYPWTERVDTRPWIHDCWPWDLVAEALVHGVLPDEPLPSWEDCRTLPDRPDTVSLAVIEEALAGQVPQFLDREFMTPDGSLDHGRIWSCLAYFHCEKFTAQIIAPPRLVYQFRNAFGGFCSTRHVHNLRRVHYELQIEHPWRDGGCGDPSPNVTPGFKTASNRASRGVAAIAERYRESHPWLHTAWTVTNRPEFLYVPVVSPYGAIHCRAAGACAGRTGMWLPVGGYATTRNFLHAPTEPVIFFEPSEKLVVHEITHSFTLGDYDIPQMPAIAIGMLYFGSLSLTLDEDARKGWCTPEELYAQAAEALVFAEKHYNNAFPACFVLNTYTQEAVATIRDTLNGTLPTWFYDEFGLSDGRIDYVSLWQSLVAFRSSGGGYQNTVVQQLGRAFGGYCFPTWDVQRAASHSEYDLPKGAEQPWVDGGCPG